jgi:uncharacterized membrane protein
MAQFCSACGGQMADGATVCPTCGKSVGVGGGAAAQMAPTSTASSGLSPNVAGLLSYLLFIPAIIFLVMEPYNKDRTIRFHSFQALFLGVASIIGHIVLGMVPFIGWLILPFFSLAVLIVAIVAAVKAFQGSKIMLPVIGAMAEKQANA